MQWNSPDFSYYSPPSSSPNDELKLEELMMQFIAKEETRFQSKEASIQKLEDQVAQLAHTLFNEAQEAISSHIEKSHKIVFMSDDEEYEQDVMGEFDNEAKEQLTLAEKQKENEE